jgi:hypothetical protein
MTAQKTMNAFNQASNKLHDPCQSFKEECQLFREDMHKGFDSLHKHFDEINEFLDTTLDDANAISKYIDNFFNFVFFTIGILAFYFLFYPH